MGLLTSLWPETMSRPELPLLSFWLHPRRPAVVNGGDGGSRRWAAGGGDFPDGGRRLGVVAAVGDLDQRREE